MHAAETDPTTTSTATRAADLASEVELSLLLTIPSMQVEDLRVYNRLFAPDWDLTLLGGTGTVSGRFEVTPRQLTLDLDLASDDAGLRHGDYQRQHGPVAATARPGGRPFIALLADERGRQAWFDDMLEMQNLAGPSVSVGRRRAGDHRRRAC